MREPLSCGVVAPLALLAGFVALTQGLRFASP